MRASILAASGLAVAAAFQAQQARHIVYFDQWHTTLPPNNSVTAGITHVITAFAPSANFTDAVSSYTPFMELRALRAYFDPSVKICMAIGGWGDTDGFSKAAATDASRKLFAKNVAAAVKKIGYNCVDVDWEFPGGNGEDYKQNPNSNKTSEIQTYPLLLSEIQKALGPYEISIAVPALERDMLAYTAEQVPIINGIVDFVNVMTYDLMNRRDNVTTHHTSVAGSLAAVERYISLGFSSEKVNLGFPFYAKWFTTAAGVTCNSPIGCPTELLEYANGTDTGKSGATTFEAANYATVPSGLVTSPDGTCGTGTNYMCAEGVCCGQYGYCGTTPAHCGTGCQAGFGRCEGISIKDSFLKAMSNGTYDKVNGGQWYWDADVEIFWTWDTTEIIARKFDEIIIKKGLGGAFSWSLGEDSHDWSHLLALQSNMKQWKSGQQCS